MSVVLALLVLLSVLVYLALMTQVLVEVASLAGHLIDRYTAREYHERGVEDYVQVVVLPLVGALVGGLLGAPIQAVADSVVSGSRPSPLFVYVNSVELFVALGLAAVLPVTVRRLYSRVAATSLPGRLYALRQQLDRAEKARLVSDIQQRIETLSRPSARGRRRLIVLLGAAAVLLLVRVTVLPDLDPRDVHLARSIGLFVVYAALALASRLVLRPTNRRLTVAHLEGLRSQALDISCPRPPQPRRRASRAKLSVRGPGAGRRARAALPTSPDGRQEAAAPVAVRAPARLEAAAHGRARRRTGPSRRSAGTDGACTDDADGAGAPALRSRSSPPPSDLPAPRAR